jgi:hypothetical protein
MRFKQQFPLTRSRTISVSRQRVETLYTVEDEHPHAAEEASGSVFPAWLDAFKVLLDLDLQHHISGGLEQTGNPHLDLRGAH